VTLVVDAGVAAKWVLPEANADRAAALREEPGGLLAPTLIVAEVGNAVWKRARRGEVTPAEAIAAIGIVRSLVTELVAMEELDHRAMEIALRLDHPIYDCFYLALAEHARTAIISADTKLLAAAERLGTVAFRAL
jgi:predicted nucleic acid-binding protein